jgi:hypothetical protein
VALSGLPALAAMTTAPAASVSAAATAAAATVRDLALWNFWLQCCRSSQ